MDHQAIAQLLGNYGEFIGSIVVLATLVYLVIQVRQNTKVLETQTLESVMTGFNDLNMRVAESSELAALLAQGRVDPSTLAEVDQLRLTSVYRSYANHWLKLLRLRERGVLSEADWARFGLEAAQSFEHAGWRQFRIENRVFEDLYEELEKLDGPPVSRTTFGRVER